MNTDNFLTTIIKGWATIIKLIFLLLKRFCKNIESLFEIFCRKKKKEKGIVVCCINPPQDIRPRPDPMVYSQDWLRSRGIAITWNNPDFKLIDVVTGIVTSNRDLRPSTKYRIEVTVHNMSVMAAINTTVNFEVKPFGIGSGILTGGIQDIINVPAVGSSIAKTIWETPADVGHICLKAIIYHPDDANPLNNVGQHNTNIVKGEERKKISFLIGNETKYKKKYSLNLDTYQLPVHAMKAENYKERQSKKYLRRLQEANNLKNFQLTNQWDFEITNEAGNPINKNELFIEKGATQKMNLNIKASPPNATTLNISAIADNTTLIGGITIQLNN